MTLMMTIIFTEVLFKPGRPVQARELTTLQSILQNQIQSFGSHVFKEGSMVLLMVLLTMMMSIIQ